MGAGDWRPSASLDALRLRARMLTTLRAFFAERGVMEVETPALSAAGSTDPHLASLLTRYHGPGAPTRGRRLYLQTSPEFPMKRLVAAGSGCIYQVARVFRDGEAGRLHNPEFSLLEWYRVGFDHHRLMDEVEALVGVLLAQGGRRGLARAERLSYAELFGRHLGVDPHGTGVPGLAGCARRHGLVPPPGMPCDDPDPWRDLLLTHLIEPHLGHDRLTFVYDYPATQAALARLRPGNPPLGERFELYLGGVELANGFHELGDAAEQGRRFRADNVARRRGGTAAVPPDRRLLGALEAGLPSCAGVALGLDRLVMLAGGYGSLADVLAFPVGRA